MAANASCDQNYFVFREKNVPCTEPVIVYPGAPVNTRSGHAMYGFGPAHFKKGEYTAQDMKRKGIMPRHLGAIKVPANCRVTLFPDEQFKGSFWEMAASFGPGEISDMWVASELILLVAGTWAAFDAPGYQGPDASVVPAQLTISTWEGQIRNRMGDWYLAESMLIEDLNGWTWEDAGIWKGTQHLLDARTQHMCPFQGGNTWAMRLTRIWKKNQIGSLVQSTLGTS